MIDLGILAICYVVTDYHAIDGFHDTSIVVHVTLNGARIGECRRLGIIAPWQFTETEPLHDATLYEKITSDEVSEEQSLQLEYELTQGSKLL